MKVLCQWSKLAPEDWREYDSTVWAALPTRSLPTGDEQLDNDPGYVCSLSVQGVGFVGYDHYAVEDLPGGAIRVTAWKDDLQDAADDLAAGNVPPGLNPSDYSPADLLYARVWELDPVAKHDGRIYNTLQRQTIYAGKALRDFHTALGPIENTTVRTWEEFVPPSSAVTRHGIWMPDELMQSHEALRSKHVWMEWAPEPVIPQGPEHHSITYLLNAPDTTDSDCVPAVDHNNKMDEAGQTSEDLSSAFTGGQTKLPFAFTTLAGDPNSTDWPAASSGDPWKCSMNIVVAGADITYSVGGADGRFGRTNSTCLEQENWVQSEAAFSGTGVKVATNTTFDPASGAASNRFQIRIGGVRAASHGNQTLTLRTDASSFAQGPWSAGQEFIIGVTHRAFASTAPILDLGFGVDIAALALAGQVPVVSITALIEVGAGIATFSELTPTAEISYNISVSPGALLLGGQLPTIVAALSIAPAVGTVSAIGQSPSAGISYNISIGPDVLTLVGVEPTPVAPQVVAIGQAALTFSEQAPQVDVSYSLSIGSGTVVLAGQQIALDLGLVVSQDTLTLAGQSPSVEVSYAINISTGLVALTGRSPEVAAGFLVSIDARVLSLVGQAPSAEISYSTLVGRDELDIVGQVPALVTSYSISIPARTVQLAGQVPIVEQSLKLLPETGVITIVGLPSSLGISYTLAIPTGVVQLTGRLPEVGTSYTLPIGIVAFAAVGQAPSTQVSDNRTTQPGAGVLTMSGLAPQLDLSDNRLPTPGTGEVTVSGWAPVSSSTGAIALPIPVALLAITGLTSPGVVMPPYSVADDHVSAGTSRRRLHLGISEGIYLGPSRGRTATH